MLRPLLAGARLGVLVIVLCAVALAQTSDLPNPPTLTPSTTQSVLGHTLEPLTAPSAGSVIRAIIGFVALLALAYLGGTRTVHRLEGQMNFAHMVTTGLPLVLAGLIAGLPQVGVLTPAVLEEVSPVLPIGLGWIGFVVGARFNARAFEQLPERLGAAALSTTAIPVVMIFCAVVWTGRLVTLHLPPAEFIRNAILLAMAGAMTAKSAPDFLRWFTSGKLSSPIFQSVVDLQQLMGVLGLMLLSAYYRPQDSLVAWHLPGTGWLFIILGIGTTMGIVCYTTFARIHSGPQFTAMLLGVIAFTSGTASYLRVSPLAVCFIAGAIAVNLGGTWKRQVQTTLEHMERPIYFLFLIIAGALWHPWDWRVWGLMSVFVAARYAAKWISGEISSWFLVRSGSAGARAAFLLAPMGALSVAIAISAQDLYSGSTMPWLFTAVIGASVINELILQVVHRQSGSRTGKERVFAETAPDIE